LRAELNRIAQDKEDNKGIAASLQHMLDELGAGLTAIDPASSC
jgi:hypothetical protein